MANGQTGKPQKIEFTSTQLEQIAERNEHDGLIDRLLGSFRLFRNPIAHTPKVKWQRDVEDAVD